MPIPMAAPSKTARNRASLACSASATVLRAFNAAWEMASCSASVRSRSAPRSPPPWRAADAPSGSAGPPWGILAAVEHQIGVDAVEAAAERLGVGAVRGDQRGADRLARGRVEGPRLQRRVAQPPGERYELLLELRPGQRRGGDREDRPAPIVANLRSLSSGPSGSARHAVRPTPANPEKDGILILGGVGPPDRHRHQTGFHHVVPLEEPRDLLAQAHDQRVADVLVHVDRALGPLRRSRDSLVRRMREHEQTARRQRVAQLGHRTVRVVRVLHEVQYGNEEEGHPDGSGRSTAAPGRSPGSPGA